MKKIISLVLCLVMLISLSACSIFDNTLVKAIKAAAELKSFHADISAQCQLDAQISGDIIGSHDINTDLAGEAAADFVLSPFAFRIDGELTEAGALPGFISLPLLTVYGESAGDSSLHVYYGTNNNFKGYALRLSGGKLNKSALLKLLTGGSKLFEKAGTEEINGFQALRYDGVLTEAVLNSLLELAAGDNKITVSGNVPVSVWIDKDSSMIVRTDIDLSQMSESIAALISDKLNTEIGGYELSLRLCPENLKLSIYFSRFNAVDSIEVPEVIAQSKSAA